MDPRAELGAPLSDQETLVVGLLAEGLSDAEIGAKLHISGNTVKTHLRRIYQKLGARNRVHAVNITFQGEAVSAARLVQVRRVLASFRGVRSDAPAGSRFALFYDQLAATLKAED
jgi:DNA-binding CsgD family transcriptional regulator